MTQQTYRAPPMTGDATSQLLQIIARDVGLTGFRPTGKGAEDARQIICLAYNNEKLIRDLWQMAADFSRALDECPELPEHVAVIVKTAILRTRSNAELGNKS